MLRRCLSWWDIAKRSAYVLVTLRLLLHLEAAQTGNHTSDTTYIHLANKPIDVHVDLQIHYMFINSFKKLVFI